LIYFTSPGISSLDDHFFHLKYAELIKNEGFSAILNFHWIYLSQIAVNKKVYPVYLFQFFLIPFTLIKDTIFSLKLSDAFWASATVSLFYYALRKSHLKGALIITLLSLTSYSAVFRLGIGRPYVIIIALVFFEMLFSVQKKYKALLWLSFFHVLWHWTTFFMPVIIIAIVEISRYLKQQHFFYKNIIYSLVGIFLAIIVNPGFLLNFKKWAGFIINITFGILSLESLKKVEGNELITKSLSDYIDAIPLAFFLYFVLAGVAIFVYLNSRFKIGEKKQLPTQVVDWQLTNEKEILLFASFIFSSGALFGAMAISGRFSDFFYFGTFYMLATAITILDERKLVKINYDLFCAVICGLFFFIILAGANSFSVLKKRTDQTDYRPLMQTAQWLKNNSPTGANVFIYDWDNFPVLISFNSSNGYSMGIEPMILLDYDKKLFWKWFNIYVNLFYCEEERDCKDKAEKAVGSFSNNQSFQNIYYKFISLGLINSIKNDFNSEIIVSNSKSFNDLIEKNSEEIEKVSPLFESDLDPNHIAKVYVLKK